MALRSLELFAAPGLTVAFRLVQPLLDYVFDFDDSTWKANVASCTAPNLSAAENTDVGDTSYSLYTAQLNLGNINPGGDPLQIVAIAIEVASPVVLINWDSAIIAGGQWVTTDIYGDSIAFGGFL